MWGVIYLDQQSTTATECCYPMDYAGLVIVPIFLNEGELHQDL